MPTESLDGFTGDIGPLLRAVEALGGKIIVGWWVDEGGRRSAATISADLPDEAEKADQCRQVIAAAIGRS